ncbi:Dihydroorotase [Labilithrix luteola]|uniref:Dihydroorotase n=1 Tax=Labilithrix luteola TaxID=1391654 RepID=A0A0K1Q8V4_9BACT|nr:dihydroorotase [Labilithrix luteola]AKV02169.1 Dihydroorotase [Labilithrix luteola]
MSNSRDVLVLRRVRAVDPSNSLDAIVDVVIEGKTITRVGPRAAEGVEGERVTEISVPGAMLLPGLIDLHAHLREPGQEYKEDLVSGLAAAAAGGFTDICAMPNTRPVNDTRAITEMLVHKSRAIGGTRLHPIGAITLGQKGDTLTEMADLKDAGAVAVSDDGHCVTRSDVMRRALEYSSTFDLPLIQHCEDHALTAGAQMHEGAVSTKLGLRGWPRVAEDVIVARDIILAEYTRAKYHIAHVSTMGAVRILREAKSRGINVTAEVTPHHLLLTDAALIGYDTACKVNPPLREDEDLLALRDALADGTIDCIATDHAPHSPLEKDCELSEASPGMIGLELCIPLMLGLVNKGVLPLARMVDALTRAPSKIAGLPRTEIKEGAEANLTLVDPAASWTVSADRLRTKSKNTPFLGQTVTGKVVLTIVSGTVVFDATTKPA